MLLRSYFTGRKMCATTSLVIGIVYIQNNPLSTKDIAQIRSTAKMNVTGKQKEILLNYLQEKPELIRGRVDRKSESRQKLVN